MLLCTASSTSSAKPEGDVLGPIWQGERIPIFQASLQPWADSSGPLSRECNQAQMLAIAGVKMLALRKAVLLKQPSLRWYVIHLAAIRDCYAGMT